MHSPQKDTHAHISVKINSLSISLCFPLALLYSTFLQSVVRVHMNSLFPSARPTTQLHNVSMAKPSVIPAMDSAVRKDLTKPLFLLAKLQILLINTLTASNTII